MIKVFKLEFKNNRFMYLSLIPFFILLTTAFSLIPINLENDILVFLMVSVLGLISPILVSKSLFSEKWFLYLMSHSSKTVQLFVKVFLPSLFSSVWIILVSSLTEIPGIDLILNSTNLITFIYFLNLLSIVPVLLTTLGYLNLMTIKNKSILLLNGVIFIFIIIFIFYMSLILISIKIIKWIPLIFVIALDITLFLLSDFLYHNLEV